MQQSNSISNIYTTSKNKVLIIITSDLNNVPNIIIIKPKSHSERIPIIDQGTIKHGIPLLYLKNCVGMLQTTSNNKVLINHQ